MRRTITLTALLAGAIAAAAIAVVAIAGGSDDGAAKAGDDSNLVSVKAVDGTDVLVDSDGRTLYSAAVEKDGRIRCTGGCESFWDPVSATANEADSASADLDLELGVVKRPDGGRQLTLDGRPLYSFTQEDPGQLDGDGFVDDFDGTHFEWEAAATDGHAESAGSSGPSIY